MDNRSGRIRTTSGLMFRGGEKLPCPQRDAMEAVL